MSKIFGDVSLALAVVLTVYLVGVMLYRTSVIVEKGGYMGVFRWEMGICAALLLLALDLRFRIFSALRFPPLVWLPRIALLALCAVVVALTAMVLAHMSDRPDAPAGHAVVLGVALEDGKPTREMLRRVETARDYAEQDPGAVLVVTGGNAAAGSASEADVMKELLMERGIGDTRILVEDRAVDTEQNFLNTAALIGPEQPIVLVTSGYHMLRALGLARHAGFEKVMGLSAPCGSLFLPANVVWEVVCEANLIMKGKVAL